MLQDFVRAIILEVQEQDDDKFIEYLISKYGHDKFIEYLISKYGHLILE